MTSRPIPNSGRSVLYCILSYSISAANALRHQYFLLTALVKSNTILIKFSKITQQKECMTMKFKKIISFAASAAACLSLLSGCASTDMLNSGGENSNSGVYNIGVLQYADHTSLDNCLEGFKQGLDSEGIEYELTAQSTSSAE